MTEFIKQNKLLSTFLFCDLLILILSFCLIDPVLVDSMEHIRASWLVSIGDVPYRDFFEHHHPLLWYLFAPMMKILPHNALFVLYFAKFCAFLFSVATGCVFYLLIKNFMGGAKLFPYFLTLYFLAYPCVYGFYFFKPDVFGRLFYFCGLYCFFLYVKEPKTRHLFWCFLALFISFCFLQTYAFDILPLIVPTLVLFYNKPKFYRDVVVALIVPSLLTAGIVYWLIHTDSWTQYFQMNWILNKEFRAIVFANAHSCIWHWMWFFGLGFIALLYQLKSSANVYFKILGWLFCCEVLQHIFILAIFPHYLVLPFIFLAFITTPIFAKYWQHNVSILGKAIKILLLGINVEIIIIFNLFSYLQVYDKINASPNDHIFNVNFCYINIYAPKLHFYEVAPYTLALVDNYLFNRFPDFDINKIIRDNDIKYIDYLAKIFTNYSLYKGRFKLSEETLKDYVEIEDSLYQRKDTLHSDK